MKLKFSKNAVKSLEKLSKKDDSKIKEKLKYLIFVINETGVIPFRDLDIKHLQGEWQGFYRLRIGKIRIIFKLNLEHQELVVYFM